jgi:hypothetical protein
MSIDADYLRLVDLLAAALPPVEVAGLSRIFQLAMAPTS